ncbi:hypothetical protein MPSEU_000653100 [Mayamaea pseudoterrestris]|nr:hypothetical protein MPSEU_000653100 [Mayamaea pseudoterrestris]
MTHPSLALTVGILLQLYIVAQGFQVQSLQGVKVLSAYDENSSVDIFDWLNHPSRKSLLVFGTYAADFNAIEYGQRLRYYWPRLRDEKKVDQCALLLNCQPQAAQALVELLDLPNDIQVWVDNRGEAGRVFGVSRGWLPDNVDVHPFLKLFGMLFGLGAWATLPAVIGGYLGNPFAGQPWIEDALTVGQRKGRWPDTALELNSNGEVASNKFQELPLVGSWPRRPLELATLRLQSMLGVSLAEWQKLAPDEEALQNGVLTQLGGCLITGRGGRVIYEWRDQGICAVANFEDLQTKI